MPVPLKTDAVAPCRLTFGSLSVAGTEEGTPNPVDNALFFETAEGLLGRVTFEGLDAIRASRGEVAPYDDGHDFSSWVYTVRKSGWLKERHAYEWKNYETPLLETHSHFLFRFHDEFVEAIAEGIWLDTASAADPFAVSEGHPLLPNFMGSVVNQGVTHGLAWKIRSVDRSPSSLVADSALCSQPLYEYFLHLDVVTVQRALGHSSATTTLNTYSHLWPTAEDRTRAAAADLMVQAFRQVDALP